MIRISAALILIAVLASCGADGEPIAPTVSGNAKIGLNSNSGLLTRTSVGIHFGSS